MAKRDDGAQRARDELDEREIRIEEIIAQVRKHHVEATRLIEEAKRIRDVAQESSRKRRDGVG